MLFDRIRQINETNKEYNILSLKLTSNYYQNNNNIINDKQKKDKREYYIH